MAVTFARTGQTVVIVDADMRRPQVAEAYQLVDEGPGLSGYLAGTVSLGDALRSGDEGRVAILPSGATPGNPSELLGSSRMADLLRELGERYDVVLVDSPPVLPVVDPLVLGVLATGVVVVVQLGQTSRERLNRTLGSIRKLNVPLLGLVANGAVARGDAAYGYGYGYGYYGRKGAARADDVVPQSGLRSRTRPERSDPVGGASS